MEGLLRLTILVIIYKNIVHKKTFFLYVTVFNKAVNKIYFSTTIITVKYKIISLLQ